MTNRYGPAFGLRHHDTLMMETAQSSLQVMIVRLLRLTFLVPFHILTNQSVNYGSTDHVTPFTGTLRDHEG